MAGVVQVLRVRRASGVGNRSRTGMTDLAAGYRAGDPLSNSSVHRRTPGTAIRLRPRAAPGPPYYVHDAPIITPNLRDLNLEPPSRLGQKGFAKGASGAGSSKRKQVGSQTDRHGSKTGG